MDSPTPTVVAAAGGSGDEKGAKKTKKKGRSYRRHSPSQIAKLEELFKECQHPDDWQRRQLGTELGLDSSQVKFWFQNKRTQLKALTERTDNNALRVENGKIQTENFILRESLKNVHCLPCRGPTSEEETRNLSLQKLRLENALLHQEHQRLSRLLADNNVINPEMPPTLQSSHDPSQGSLQNQNNNENPALGQLIHAPDPHIYALDHHIPVVDQGVHTHTPTLEQHITDPAPTPALNQDIPTLNRATDQNFYAITAARDQNIPALTYAFTAVPNQNFCAITPAPDQNISALTHPISLSLDQSFYAVTPAYDQNIPTLTHPISLAIDQSFSVVTSTPGQNIPALTHPISPTLDQSFSAITPAPNQNIPALTHAGTLTIDQNFCATTPASDQNISSVTHAMTPSLDQNFYAITSTPDQNILALAHAHHQDISALISAIDQDISAFSSVFDQDFPMLSPALDQHIPTLDQDIPAVDLDFGAVFGVLNDYMLPHPMSAVTRDTGRALMTEIANTAMEELTRLLRMNEPFWFRSIVDGKFVLQRGTYEKIFHRSNFLMGPHVRIESSKDTRIVSMSGTQLVEMFINSDKWVDIFPTIVKKAQTTQVFESGSLGSRNGALQLMNAKMHILSPLVPTREFIFLRYCKQIEAGIWVIADVSFDDSSTCNTTLCRGWRFPSGCMIHEITNRSCRVSWVEHVEVDEKNQTDWLFREVICGNNDAYGAEKWLLTLERMCERFASASLENTPSSDTGVICSAEGRRSVMTLAHRMIKMFCATLDMSSDNWDYAHLTKLNNGGVRVSIRKCREPSVPNGMIVSAATSFWLPLSPQNVYDFLKDNSKRFQWDVLCNGHSVHEIQRISNGTNPGNYISVIRPYIPKEDYMLILQESYIDPLESLLVYAPIDIATLNVAMRGEDSSLLPLLPSGFTITRDGRSNAAAQQSGQVVGKSEGSLVTLLYQVLVCTPSALEKLDVQSVTRINTLVTSTVEKIKFALNCCN